MRVIHIIPSAFEYFDDIRSKAFKVVEGLHGINVETEAFTLQYGSTSKAIKSSVAEASPSVHSYQSSTGAAGLVESLESFDLVHLHCPFLGAAGKILHWKKTHPKIPLVVTYYRDVLFTDIFSLFIKFYNAYYLPKIFKAASIIICEDLDILRRSAGAKYIPEKKDVMAMDRVPLEKKWGKFNKQEAVAAKVFLIYNTILS